MRIGSSCQALGSKTDEAETTVSRHEVDLLVGTFLSRLVALLDLFLLIDFDIGFDHVVVTLGAEDFAPELCEGGASSCHEFLVSFAYLQRCVDQVRLLLAQAEPCLAEEQVVCHQVGHEADRSRVCWLALIVGFCLSLDEVLGE